MPDKTRQQASAEKTVQRAIAIGADTIASPNAARAKAITAEWSNQVAARESRRRAWLEARAEEIGVAWDCIGIEKAADLLREACESYQRLD